jgi:hypothetical protein
MEHYISFNEIQNLTVKEAVEAIHKKEKKEIKSLRLIDLMFENKSQIGVYIFFDPENNPIYVGKTGSRAILERVAAHLDLRSGAFMNNFLCALAGKNKGDKKIKASDEDIHNVYETALNHRFIFIGIPDKPLINRIERVLANELKPTLNRLTGVRKYNESDKINELL